MVGQNTVFLLVAHFKLSEVNYNYLKGATNQKPLMS